MEYYSARKRDEVLMDATWMNLKIIIPHESQSEKATYDSFI